MDKDYAKRPPGPRASLPRFQDVLPAGDERYGRGRSARHRREHLGYPLAVKPAHEGSSFGLSRVEESDELLDAVYEAFGYDAKILLERWVDGTEVSVPILEPAGEEPRALGLVEIRPREGAYNFEAKYTRALRTSRSRPRSPRRPQPTSRRRR